MNMIKKISMGFCIAACLAGCGKMDSAELAEKVRAEMQRDLVKQDLYAGLKLDALTLIHKGGVRYEGVGKGMLCELPIEFKVTCDYDGVSMLWKAEPIDENSLTISGRQSGKYCREKIMENWPKVKKGAKAAYDAAAKKTGEWYDKTRDKAIAGYNELKGKVKDFQKPAETNSCATAK